MSSRTAAESRVKASFDKWQEARKAQEEFIAACRDAHDIFGISDQRLSDLIDNEYSRSSICQFRNKENHVAGNAS